MTEEQGREVLIDFYEEMQELGAETDGSNVDVVKLDMIYDRALRAFGVPLRDDAAPQETGNE